MATSRTRLKAKTQELSPLTQRNTTQHKTTQNNCRQQRNRIWSNGDIKNQIERRSNRVNTYATHNATESAARTRTRTLPNTSRTALKEKETPLPQHNEAQEHCRQQRNRIWSNDDIENQTESKAARFYSATPQHNNKNTF
jgi:hypothetical protein